MTKNDERENTQQFIVYADEYEYAIDNFENFLRGLSEGNNVTLESKGHFKVTIEWHEDDELCPHGGDFDDCPDCRH